MESSFDPSVLNMPIPGASRLFERDTATIIGVDARASSNAECNAPWHLRALLAQRLLKSESPITQGGRAGALPYLVTGFPATSSSTKGFASYILSSASMIPTESTATERFCWSL
jgi:hypothetical protein